MSLRITNVRLAFDEDDDDDAQRARARGLYAVRCVGGTVRSVVPMDAGSAGDEADEDDSDGGAVPVPVLDGGGGLLIPSLCHSHIHLDKCYILDKGEPLVTGDFAEALRVTARAKAGFRADADDLYARGTRLVRASVAAGVTCMRAHVEVDRTVGDACVRAALRVKAAWRGVCDVLICVFMQDPLFDEGDEDGEDALGRSENARLLDEVLAEYCPAAAASSSAGRDPNAGLISAVGSAPYVERTRAQQLANIAHVLGLARAHGLHVDFHLDYDLARAHAAPLLWSVLAHLEGAGAGLAPHTAVTIGHVTRVTRFPPARLRELCARVDALAEGRAGGGAPCMVHLVGLPQSDVYMMGRRPAGEEEEDEAAYDAPRGTMNVVRLRTEYGMRTAAMAVNNVGNAFTPQGAPDPLGLCPLGVAVYQDGTARGCRALFEAVTCASKHAVGERAGPGTLLPTVGRAADFVVLHENGTAEEAALAPSYARTTVKGGSVVAWRRTEAWTDRDECGSERI